MLICEMAAWYRSKGMNLYDGLVSLWERYGYFRETLKSIQMAGKEGMKKITAMMDHLRENEPDTVAGVPVVRIEDYLTGKAVDVKTGRESKLTLPVSNVLKFSLEDGSWFCARPSGTEPKVKLYFSVTGNSLEDADAKDKALIDAVYRLVQPEAGHI